MVLLFSSLGRLRGQAAYKDQSRFEHLPVLKAVKRTHEADVCFGKFARPNGEKGSHTVPHLHDSHGCQIANPLAQAGAADLERPCKFPLRRYFVTGPGSAILDQSADVVNHIVIR